MMPVRIIVTIPVLCIGLCSVIKVDDSEDPLLDAVEKVADSLILFCQVDIGWLNGSAPFFCGRGPGFTNPASSTKILTRFRIIVS